MTDEEIAKCEYHLKHMPMSALRRRIETLSASVDAMSNYVYRIDENDKNMEERLHTAAHILADLTAEYCDIVQCTEICNLDDSDDLEKRRDE